MRFNVVYSKFGDVSSQLSDDAFSDSDDACYRFRLTRV